MTLSLDVVGAIILEHLTLPASNVYDPQLHHGSIPSIERLSRLRYPAYGDKPYLQALALQYWTMHRQAMLDAPFADAEVTRAQQFAKVAFLVDYAFTHIPFYARLYGAAGYQPGGLRSWADFEALPIVDKPTLAKLEDNAMVVETEGQPKFTTRSSGSSGIPFSTHLDTFDVIRDGAEFLRFFTEAAGGRLDPGDWIYTIHHGGFWFSSLCGHYRIFQLMDVEDADDVARHWTLLRPRVISTLPSYLPRLADIGRLDRFGIVSVATNSEMSSRAERDRYARIFGVPVIDEYSSEEVGFMATECTDGCYHVVEDGVYLEIVDPDGQGNGHVVVTDLNNLMMPLIRYDHNDAARWSGATCSCGRKSRVLSELHGRRNDAFMSASGQYIPTASLLAFCDEQISDEDYGVTAYRCVQRSPRRIEFIYTKAPTALLPMEALCADINRQFNALFGHDIEFKPIEVKELPQTGSYKRRVLLRQFDGAP